MPERYKLFGSVDILCKTKSLKFFGPSNSFESSDFVGAALRRLLAVLLPL